MVMVMRRLAEHERRLALRVGARRDLAFRLQMVERAIDGRQRDARAAALELLVNLGGGKKARFALQEWRRSARAVA